MYQQLIDNLKGMVKIANELMRSPERKVYGQGCDVLQQARNLIPLYSRIAFRQAAYDYDTIRQQFNDIVGWNK